MRKLVVVAGTTFVLGVGLAIAADAVRDSTIADGDVHQVVLENDHVRVFEAMAASGHKSPMHSHPPMVLVSLGTARGKLTLADGKTQIFTLHPGSVFWIDGAQHSWELLSGELHAVGVEVKGVQPAPKP